MQRIIFIDTPEKHFDDSAFVAHVSGNIKSKEELLSELSRILLFPDYFGFNWDSLFDCLRDFEWISKKIIVLVHDNMPELDKNALENYMEILVEATNDWNENDAHCLEIIFPKTSEKLLSQYL